MNPASQVLSQSVTFTALLGAIPHASTLRVEGTVDMITIPATAVLTISSGNDPTGSILAAALTSLGIGHSVSAIA